MKIAVLIGLVLSIGCPRIETPCAVTEPISAPAPEGTEGGPPDASPLRWHVNSDRSIWMLDQDWVSGQRMKVAWFRPAGTQLTASGRRLDGPAPRMLVEFPEAVSYPHRFTPSSMTFPTGGCWEITAKVDQS